VSNCQAPAGGLAAKYISDKAKRGKEKTESSRSGIVPESSFFFRFLMTGYRLRQLDIDDKVCEQMDLGLVQEISPKEVIERCVQESQPWASKARRVRKVTASSLVFSH
jgi:hypothetical protein